MVGNTQRPLLLSFSFQEAALSDAMDEMELTGKYLKCGSDKHTHNFPADLCIMIVLNRLSYPGTCKSQVEVFGIRSNRISDMFHIAVDHGRQPAPLNDHLSIFSNMLKKL